MAPEPLSERWLIELPAGEGQDDCDDLFLRRIDPKAVQPEKEVHRLEGDALVAIQKGMVARESESVRSCERREVRLGLVAKQVARAFQRRVQQSPISNSERAAVGLDLIRVYAEHVDRGDPAWFGRSWFRHLASSRIALRYFLAPSA